MSANQAFRSSATPVSGLSSIDEKLPVMSRNSTRKSSDDKLIKVSVKEDTQISDDGTTIKETKVEQTTYTSTDMGDVAKKYLTDGFFWLFFFIIAAVIISFYFIAYSGLTWLSGMDKLGWLTQPAVYYAFFIVLALIGTVPAYIGFANGDPGKKAAIFSSFLLTSALWVLLALVFFIGHELTWAVVIGMLLLVSSIMLTASVWTSNRDCGICIVFWAVFALLTFAGICYIYAYNMPNNTPYTPGSPTLPSST